MISCVRPHIDWEENESILYKGVELLPNRRILKTLRESSKEKPHRRQYQLAVGSGCYKWYRARHQAMC